MLIENDKHKKYHSAGPKDCHWGDKEKAVCSIQVTRSTLQNEQMTISVPVFCDDDRESLDLRLGMMMSLAQDRLDDANEAWKQAKERSEKELDREAELAKKKKHLDVAKGE